MVYGLRAAAKQLREGIGKSWSVPDSWHCKKKRLEAELSRTFSIKGREDGLNWQQDVAASGVKLSTRPRTRLKLVPRPGKLHRTP